MLREVVDWLFTVNDTSALDLHVGIDNSRARHVYAREGFVEGGRDDLQGEGMILSREAWTTLPRRAHA